MRCPRCNSMVVDTWDGPACVSCGWCGETRTDVPLDGPPERIAIPEDGCVVAATCAECPLPDCMWYKQLGDRLPLVMRRAARDAQIAASLDAGLPREAIAEAHGISPRTVYRISRSA